MTKLIITIDTEEDNWSSYSSSDNPLTHFDRIPGLQALFDEYGVRPTYLIDYPVAMDDKAVDILSQIQDSGRCEIGSHCHPWNTPPFRETINKSNSMICNLDPSLQLEKLRNLHSAIENRFEVAPRSFRAGRWGLGSTVVENLITLGYLVDTSVTALTDWSTYLGPDYSQMLPHPYYMSPPDIFMASGNGELLEIPATVGFLRGDFAKANRIYRTLQGLRPIPGLLYRLGLLKKVWFSPEMNSGEEMIRLARKMLRDKYPFINMTFHSPSIKAGLTPFVKTAEDEMEFLSKIRSVLDFTRDSEIGAITLSESVNHFKRNSTDPESGTFHGSRT